VGDTGLTVTTEKTSGFFLRNPTSLAIADVVSAMPSLIGRAARSFRALLHTGALNKKTSSAKGFFCLMVGDTGLEPVASTV
jgi:hypothetical protein